MGTLNETAATAKLTPLAFNPGRKRPRLSHSTSTCIWARLSWPSAFSARSANSATA